MLEKNVSTNIDNIIAEASYTFLLVRVFGKDKTITAVQSTKATWEAVRRILSARKP